MVTGNTNRKAAEKLNGDHSYCSQIQQLDFNSCYLQLRQSLMLRQAVEEPSLRDSREVVNICSAQPVECQR